MEENIMGRVVTKNNKVKFEIKDKQDCILYLGHLIEYVEKKNDIYWHLILETTAYLAFELQYKGINISGDEDVIKFIIQKYETNFNFDIDFYKFKLFNSSLNLIKNEIINVIGDFSRDKIAISYNNYLNIIHENKIQGVYYQDNNDRKKLIDWFNTQRNYLYHFSSDKLCEWISYREEQIEKYSNVDFEFGKEFNVYIPKKISYKVFVEEFEKNILFYEEIKKALQFMKKDFEELIGSKVNFNIKEGYVDNSVNTITSNGFKSHERSKKRKSK